MGIFRIFTALLLLGAGAASAAIMPVFEGPNTDVEMYLKQNTFPGGLVEEKVFLDAALLSTITGHVGSQTDSRLVMFSSTTDILDAANGFATINAQDGILNNITISAPGYWFEDLIFSLNLVSQSTAGVSVTATDKSGDTDTYSGWTAETNWVSGENRILVLATSGNLLQSVTINSLNGIISLGGIDQLKQTEISGLTVVPVPAAIWLFGTALIGFVGMSRRTRV
jgi:hypothetical protein